MIGSQTDALKIRRLYPETSGDVIKVCKEEINPTIFSLKAVVLKSDEKFPESCQKKIYTYINTHTEEKSNLFHTTSDRSTKVKIQMWCTEVKK